jgi:hypothetical protein
MMAKWEGMRTEFGYKESYAIVSRRQENKKGYHRNKAYTYPTEVIKKVSDYSRVHRKNRR